MGTGRSRGISYEEWKKEKDAVSARARSASAEKNSMYAAGRSSGGNYEEWKKARGKYRSEKARTGELAGWGGESIKLLKEMEKYGKNKEESSYVFDRAGMLKRINTQLKEAQRLREKYGGEETEKYIDGIETALQSGSEYTGKYAEYLRAKDYGKVHEKYGESSREGLEQVIKNFEQEIERAQAYGETGLEKELSGELGMLKEYLQAKPMTPEDYDYRIAKLEAEGKELLSFGEERFEEYMSSREELERLKQERAGAWYAEQDKKLRALGEETYEAVMKIPSLEEKYAYSSGNAALAEELNKAERYLEEMTEEDRRGILKYAEAVYDAETAAEANSEIAEAVRKSRGLERLYYSAVLRPVMKLGGGILGTAEASAEKIGNLLTGENAPVNYNNRGMRMMQIGDTITRERSEMIKRATEGWIGSDSIFGNLYSKGYELAMSIEDSAIAAALTASGIPGNVLLGGAASASAMASAKERGATDGQALVTGLLGGLAESFFEKASIGSLLEPERITGAAVQWGESIKKQMLTEGGEEAATSIANTLTDILVNGDKSELKRRIREKGGDEKAVRETYREWFIGILGDVIGGMVSGGISKAGKNLYDMNSTYEAGSGANMENLLKLTEKVDAKLGEYVAAGNTEFERGLREYSAVMESLKENKGYERRRYGVSGGTESADAGNLSGDGEK